MACGYVDAIDEREDEAHMRSFTFVQDDTGDIWLTDVEYGGRMK